jgi:glycosyltransferase involved in cell wall biosynthesis
MMQSPKLKVCHFASVHTLNDTRVFWRECVSLAREFEVTFIGIGEFTGIKEGVNLVGIPKPKSRIRRLLFTRSIAFYKALLADSDLYHFHDAELIPFGILLRLCGKKVIYDIHENTAGDIRYKPWIAPVMKKVLRSVYLALEWMGAQFMHYILVIAKPAFASRFHSRHYTIIQNFADLSQMRPYRVTARSSLAGNHLFYMGTVHDMYYDFNRVVEALVILKRSLPDVKLHCVGESSEYQRELTEHPVWDEVGDHIVFYGTLTPDQGYSISQQCKAGICLKNQPEKILVSHERKLFEYLACGLPFVCADAHIYRELVDETKAGINVDLSDANAIAAGVKVLLSDPRKLDEAQHNGEQAAEKKYNWESQQKLLIHLYKFLMKT